jgi:hypothetical protein
MLTPSPNRPTLQHSGHGIAFGGAAGVSRVDFSNDGGMSWHETEPGKDEGNIQFPTMADARMDYKAPIEPKDGDAIVALISIRSWNQARGRRIALFVKHQ